MIRFIFLLLFTFSVHAQDYRTFDHAGTSIQGKVLAWLPSTQYLEGDFVYGSLVSLDVYVAIANFISSATTISDDLIPGTRWQIIAPETLGTGLLFGGLATQNAGNPNNIDIATGRGGIQNHYDQIDRQLVIVNWGNLADIVVNVAPVGAQVTIYMNAAGVPFFAGGLPNGITIKDNMLIGRILYDEDNVTIRGIFPQRWRGFDTNSYVRDFMGAIGIISLPPNGNIYGCNLTDLDLNKTGGNLFGIGFNFDNPRNPNLADTPALNPVPFLYALQNELTDAAVTDLDPDNFDDGGTLTAVPADEFSVQTIYLGPNNNTIIQYGEATFSTQTEAVDSIDIRNFIPYPGVIGNAASLRGVIIVEQGTTVCDTYLFLPANKFGTGGSSATAGGDVAGPVNSFDGSVPTFDGVSGKVLDDLEFMRVVPDVPVDPQPVDLGLIGIYIPPPEILVETMEIRGLPVALGGTGQPTLMLNAIDGDATDAFDVEFIMARLFNVRGNGIYWQDDADRLDPFWFAGSMFDLANAANGNFQIDIRDRLDLTEDVLNVDPYFEIRRDGTVELGLGPLIVKNGIAEPGGDGIISSFGAVPDPVKFSFANANVAVVSTDYALAQDETGDTYINAPTQGAIHFRVDDGDTPINNFDMMLIDDDITFPTISFNPDPINIDEPVWSFGIGEITVGELDVATLPADVTTYTLPYARDNEVFEDHSLRLDEFGNATWRVGRAGVTLVKTGTQSIPNATWTALTFNNEMHDVGGPFPNGFFDFAANTVIATVPLDGMYSMSCTGHWANQRTGGQRFMRFIINPTDIVTNGRLGYTGMVHLDAGGTEGNRSPQSTSAVSFLTAGTTIQIHVWQNSGGNSDWNTQTGLRTNCSVMAQ